jgi:sugar transferase EpsL
MLPDEQRITQFGQTLRRSSLDELPELINVLVGDMSLVGPRPPLMSYLHRYTREQMRRHDVLPGITGLAQVSGRNNLSWDEKFALDVWYVDHRSLWLDINVLAMTVRAVLGIDITVDHCSPVMAQRIAELLVQEFVRWNFGRKH